MAPFCCVFVTPVTVRNDLALYLFAYLLAVCQSGLPVDLLYLQQGQRKVGIS